MTDEISSLLVESIGYNIPHFVPIPSEMGMKNIFKRYTPARAELQNHRHLTVFGQLLHEPNLWHITRHSSAGGIANGLFWAFMPFPGQTIMAAAIAIWFRINLPISILGVWLTNPLTIYPIFLASYKTGNFILGRPAMDVHFEISWTWFTSTMLEIWQPLLLGCVLLGSICALLGYFSIRLLWRFTAIRKWEERKERRRQRQTKQSD